MADRKKKSSEFRLQDGKRKKTQHFWKMLILDQKKENLNKLL